MENLTSDEKKIVPQTVPVLLDETSITCLSPPDGGIKAWSVIAGAWLVLFAQFGLITAFGTLQAWYEQHQLSAYPKSTISWIGSIQTFLLFGLCILSGRRFDSHGPRWLMIVGSTFAVTSLVAIAFCKEFYQFFLAHSLFGIAGSILYSPACGVAGQWFTTNKATAVGVLLSGSGVGGVVFPIIMTKLFPILGFRNTMLILAALTGISLVVACFLVDSFLPPRLPMPWRNLSRIWKDLPYLGLVGGISCIWLNYFSPYFFSVGFANERTSNATVVSYAVVIINVGSFTGRALSGFLADHKVFGIGCLKALIVSNIGGALTLLFLWTLTKGAAGVVAAIFLYGMFSGAVVSLIASTCASTGPKEEFGLRLGMLWTVSSVFILIGPQASGELVSSSGGYITMAVFGGVLMMFGCLLLLLSSRGLRGKVFVCFANRKNEGGNCSSSSE